MKIEIKVPPVGESVVEATIGALLQPSGTVVAADSELLELETDKVNQVVYAPAAGKVQFIVAVGDRVTVGQVIGSIDTTASADTASQAPVKSADVQSSHVQSAPPAEPSKKQTPSSPFSTQMPSVR
jgi:2-oxoglutarate dehydrogenase E2 component (dihydrolipoamide succinyltransferase)